MSSPYSDIDLSSSASLHPKLSSDSDSESLVSTICSVASRPSTSASSTPPPFLFPSTVPKYCLVVRELEELLRSRLHDPSSEIAQDALRQVALSLPFHPTPQIKWGHPLNWPFPQIRVDMHLNTTFNDALDNIGMPLPEREEIFLQYLIQHPWGWSATPKQHRNASGFRYLSKLYPEVKGLRPVLDNVV